MRTTLVAFGESSALGDALKLVNNQPGISIVTKPLNASSGFLLGQVIATNLGASFLYLEREEDLPLQAIATLSFNFSTLVCIVNVGKLKAGELLALQRRAPQRALFCPAYNAEEAAEFVLSLVARLSDVHLREQAAQMLEQGKPVVTDATRSAFSICEHNFPIPPRETRALLEAAGSIRELCEMKDSMDIAARSPLSNQDAEAVARVLGLPITAPSVLRLAASANSLENIKRFF